MKNEWEEQMLRKQRISFLTSIAKVIIVFSTWLFCYILMLLLIAGVKL